MNQQEKIEKAESVCRKYGFIDSKGRPNFSLAIRQLQSQVDKIESKS